MNKFGISKLLTLVPIIAIAVVSTVFSDMKQSKEIEKAVKEEVAKQSKKEEV